MKEEDYKNSTLEMTHSLSSSPLERLGEVTNRIAIQGVRGAFHEIATRRYFADDKNLSIVETETFEDLIRITDEGIEADAALMAIENTIAGSLVNNYKLLNNSNLHIQGEVYLRIHQNLMALPNVCIEDLKEVYSHPVALMQCTEFFKNYPHIKLIEATDTALSAKMIRDEKRRDAAAIASTLAAEMYELNIIAPSIETFKKNYTRFLVLQRVENEILSKNFNKVSICFSLKHEVGSLYKVLAQLALRNANLTKIQSLTIPEETWHYLFFLDFTFDKYQDFEMIMHELPDFTANLKVLGRYQEGKYYER